MKSICLALLTVLSKIISLMSVKKKKKEQDVKCSSTLESERPGIQS